MIEILITATESVYIRGLQKYPITRKCGFVPSAVNRKCGFVPSTVNRNRSQRVKAFAVAMAIADEIGPPLLRVASKNR